MQAKNLFETNAIAEAPPVEVVGLRALEVRVEKTSAGERAMLWIACHPILSTVAITAALTLVSEWLS